ncbi:putative glucuronosyltransferase PGSIP8 [Cynara cardunculus var. scolymus]|uniref:Glycosyl transferase, family 8 n=1 Tax=Cynara cardunculus var. scolymus TaxID=59895 RepID=A0A124SD13_CYNCS|nr:putative glucuronosyltransferase PGSIP8 [Cynara cardunculus var. scolymus]KVH95517.1 Glycosyl transferase, family 8 [Cynara cardunculus var. scolymus]
MASRKTAMWIVSILMAIGAGGVVGHRNAYATMMYMGTARDYEFYVAIRVMLRSLILKLRVNADLVVIASLDVPLHWIHALEEEDGAKVVRVENLKNPYNNHDRFKLTLNKVYAWSLVEYERVIMLDADNLFLQNTDELFQCGHFCAVFINPCIFHTGLFVLQPSSKVFKNMLHDLDIGRDNPDGADQGFIGGYFAHLLDQPMFHPPSNGTRLDGTFRLPLGYQMDASYYYLRLRWSVPCGPNSVITFPGAPWLKPWYWWSWPVLPLGIQWHEQRRETLGYESEMPLVLIQTIVYLGIIAITRLGRPTTTLTKLCYRGADRNLTIIQTSLKAIAIFSILISYTLPFLLIPHTVHPIFGWTLYLLGSFALSCSAIIAFHLPMVAVVTPWVGIVGVLLVMAFPWYNDGVVRALSVFGYAFCFSPLLWISMGKIGSSLHSSLGREALNLLPSRVVTVSTQPDHGFNKLY